MNSDTGKVMDYNEAAKLWPPEKLVPISDRAAKKIRLGRSLLAERLRAERKKRRSRARDRIAKASRKANR